MNSEQLMLNNAMHDSRKRLRVMADVRPPACIPGIRVGAEFVVSGDLIVQCFRSALCART